MKHTFLRGLLLAAPTLSPAFAAERPNVIVFLVDDMGLMDTSLPFLTDGQGNPVRHPLNDWYRTPNMERLARQGTRFSTFYAQSVSSPSRASLMTGQNAARHHTTNWINSESNNRNQYGPYGWNWQGLRRSELTLPRLLQEAGYRTIHVGKAHFGCIGSEGEFPQNLGFDVNIAGSSIGQPGSYYGQNGYGYTGGNRSRAVPGLEKYHGTDTFLTDALTLEANAQIDTALALRTPFFLYLAHYAVHAPFEVDPRYAGHYPQTEGKSDAARDFATLIEGMDRSLGAVMDHLEEKGIAENTLIIFLGDNGSDAPLGASRGYSSSAPLRGKKGSEFEGGMRVPCIVGWGKTDPANASQRRFPVRAEGVVEQLGTVMDIYPTVADVAGVAIPPSHVIDGKSLRLPASGKVDPAHEKFFLMHFPHNHRGSYFTVYREGDWKLIYYYNPEHPERPDCALYNLKADPAEREECSLHEKTKTLEMLRRMADRLRVEGAQYPVDFDGNEVRPDIAYFEQQFGE